MSAARMGWVVALVLSGSGCATLGSLGQIVQPPRFIEDPDRPAEVRLVGPAVDEPLGGAVIRLWMRVSNPNPFGFRLTRLQADLRLDGSQAARGDFPLGLPLAPREESTVPLDLSISFADIPGLSRAVQRAAGGGRVAYQLAGTVGVDAGTLGEPTFGPMTLMEGDLAAVRR